MSLYRPAGSRIYWMDFHFHGQRIRESTEMPSITRAREVQAKRKQELRDGAAGIRKRESPKLFSVAARDWIEAKTPKWSPRMLGIAENSMKHLAPAFGKKLVVDVEARDVTRYQKARKAANASNRTVNIEVGCLRSVLKRHGLGARIQPGVEMLPERDDVGRALSAEEETVLLAECGKSRSRLLLPFVLVAIETAARCGTIRRLQWKNVDFTNRCLTFGKDKTRAGSGRTIPLTPRALETLRFWAQSFPERQPDHYVFCHERYGGAGTDEVFGFTNATVFETDPMRPTGAVKVAWEQARKRAGLPGCRLHDLRHTGCSRMIAARVPLPIIAKIVGWSAGTLAKMAARYGHFSIEEMRSALESIERPAAVENGEIVSGYPKKSPKSGPARAGGIQ
jgi:integrase